MEIAQVLYDVQFTAYLRKTFIEDANQMGKNGGGIINTGGNNGINPININPQQQQQQQP